MPLLPWPTGINTYESSFSFVFHIHITAILQLVTTTQNFTGNSAALGCYARCEYRRLELTYQSAPGLRNAEPLSVATRCRSYIRTDAKLLDVSGAWAVLGNICQSLAGHQNRYTHQ